VIENAMKTIEIGRGKIGPGEPTFLIAEAGVNHNGQLPLAKRLVDIACEAGADAVKFQTFRADRLAGLSAPKADYQKQTTPAGESQLMMLRQLELSEAAFREVRNHCSSRGIIFLSTPFDEESVDFLDDLGVPAFKVPSGEITNWPLLERIGAKGKPAILSTGMSNLGEIDEAVRRLRNSGSPQMALLQCVSEYPARVSTVNLRAMATLARCFGTPVGLSDHTLGIEIAIAAVALGARIIEKHFTIDKTLAGPDHSASLEPHELRMLVKGIRDVEAALGDGIKEPTPQELRNAAMVRRSLVAAVELEIGSRLEPSMVTLKRPGTGLSASALPYILGRRLRRRVEAGALLELGMFE
jgi:N,N'-diacetyllegionaminate synthase